MLKDAVPIAKSEFQETMQKSNQIEKKLEVFLTTTKEVIDDQRELADREERNIEETFAKLHQLLEERKRTMIQQLKDQVLQTKNLLDNQQAVIDQRLSLTTLQQLCIQKMLDSNDSIRILDFYSNFYQNYNNFDEQYTEINEGYTIKTYLFKKDERDIEQISNIISRLGYTTATVRVVKDDNVTTKTSPLDILGQCINTRSSREFNFSGENNIARGYKFRLTKTLRLQSVRIYSNQIGQITCFIANDTGVIIQNSTINSTEPIMKCLSIPIECDIRNHYSVFVVTSANNGLYICKKGDDRPHTVNKDCSVESMYTHAVAQVTIGSKIFLYKSNTAVHILLDIVDCQ
jgi:hypothetical protein